MTLFTPPTNIEGGKPVIFLAGPIQGARDWQTDAVAHIHDIDPDILIASPRRLAQTRGEFSDAMYYEQVDWEHDHLDRAAANGSILFWLSREAEHRCDRSYAQTTRFELGVALGWHRFMGAKVVVGIDEGFSNARYIRYTLGKKYPGLPILDDLRSTCDAAVSALAA